MNDRCLHAIVILSVLVVAVVEPAEVDAGEDERTTVGDTPVVEGGYSKPVGLMCCDMSCGPGWRKAYRTYRPTVAGSEGAVVGQTRRSEEQLEAMFAEMDRNFAGCRALSLPMKNTWVISKVTGTLSVEFNVDNGEDVEVAIRDEETDISKFDGLYECLTDAVQGVHIPTSDEHEVTIRRAWEISYDTDNRVQNHPGSEMHGERGHEPDSAMVGNQVDMELLEVDGVQEGILERRLLQQELKRDLQRCYFAGIWEDRELEGDISLRHVTLSNGESGFSTVQESTLEDEVMVECVKHKLSDSFPDLSRFSDDDGVDVLLRFKFSAEEVDG